MGYHPHVLFLDNDQAIGSLTHQTTKNENFALSIDSGAARPRRESDSKFNEYLFYTGHTMRAEHGIMAQPKSANSEESFHYRLVKNYKTCKVLELAGLPHDEVIYT